MHAVKSKKANKKVKQGHCSYNMAISFFNYAETINFLLRQKTPTFSYNWILIYELYSILILPRKTILGT